MVKKISGLCRTPEEKPQDEKRISACQFENAYAELFPEEIRFFNEFEVKINTVSCRELLPEIIHEEKHYKIRNLICGIFAWLLWLSPLLFAIYGWILEGWIIGSAILVCCLLPGVGNNNINVISIVDRYLEHSRIFYFANDDSGEYYLASADFMTRNLDRRIEILFPVTRQENCQKLMKILAFELNDKFKARLLKSNGKYSFKSNNNPASRSQQNIYNLFASEVRSDSAAKELKIFTSDAIAPSDKCDQ